MIVWDRGIYRSRDGHAPAEGLAAGKLDLGSRATSCAAWFALVWTKRGASGCSSRSAVGANEAS
jgi:hypothetical protein